MTTCGRLGRVQSADRFSDRSQRFVLSTIPQTREQQERGANCLFAAQPVELLQRFLRLLPQLFEGAFLRHRAPVRAPRRDAAPCRRQVAASTSWRSAARRRRSAPRCLRLSGCAALIVACQQGIEPADRIQAIEEIHPGAFHSGRGKAVAPRPSRLQLVLHLVESRAGCRW